MWEKPPKICKMGSGLVSCILNEKLRRQLERVVKSEKISRSDIIRDAVERYVALKRFQQIRKKVLPFAEAEGLVTDEDIFRSIS